MAESNDRENFPPWAFYDLRKIAHQQCADELTDRLKNNPEKTPLEEQMGCYVEELEPQVREAVLELNRKGYKTYSSGFFGTYDNSTGQTIGFGGGELVLPAEVEAELRVMGVSATCSAEYNGSLIFYADVPDLDAIKSRWDEIAALIPEKSSIK